MEFIPLYYADKIRRVSLEDSFNKENLNVINPHGRAGIVTLWSKPWDVWNVLKQEFPSLFEKDSPLITITSLYGNGLPQMLANLSHNPQVEYLAVTGNDTKVVPSFTYLINFLQKGVIPPQEQKPLGKINGTEFAIDPNLNPSLLTHLKVRRFPISDLQGIASFVSQPPTIERYEKDRIKIRLIEPVFSDFPSDKMMHTVKGKTPLETWMSVMYLINRFGKNISLKKGLRRALYNLAAIIENPEPESPKILQEFGFDYKELNSYREDILKGEPLEGMTYSYGNRLHKYFKVDALESVISRIKKDPLDRRGFITLWDNQQDIISPNDSDSSVPCLTDLYFVNIEDSLTLTASFRTHAATSAWLLNLYGLRAIQEYVSNNTGIKAGRIEIISRWIGMDPNDGKTIAALDLTRKHRKIKLDVHDPRGYLVVEKGDDEIIVEHYSQSSEKLGIYRGKSAEEIKNQLRQEAVIMNPDHAMWIGYELARAHLKLHGELPEL